MSKLVHQSSQICAKSELDLFTTPSTQEMILGGKWIDVSNGSKNWKYRPDGTILVSSPDGSTRIVVEFRVWETLTNLLEKLVEKILLAGVHADIKFDKNTSKIFIQVPDECSIEFESGLHETLGFKKTLFIGNPDPYVSDYRVNINLNTINSLYIYSDICEFQLVGDTEAPLLQVVSTNESSENYVEKIFDSPHYIPLARNNLENIEIDIRCDLGRPIQFQSGKVVVKLHFRKKNFF